MINMEQLPTSVAIIMDGNGRWAKKRGLPRVVGHNAGMKAMKAIVKKSSDIGIKFLTVYAFSTENWKRSDEEVSGIFKLLIKYIDGDLEELHKNNVRVKIIGEYEHLHKEIVSRLEKTLEKTKNNTGLQFNIALNYGSRAEIIRAVKGITKDALENKTKISEINEESFQKYLYTGEYNVPDPDLLIRTSGETRLSNYLLWQLAYSEMVFVDTLWPDFTPKKYEKVIKEYQSRNRRFGGR